ncbi:MAG: penicillin-binding protein 2 [Anaerolineaceae bacterium]|nr:penicillin-binding protein 2 [Anaerolineaceae bacterium]MBN2676712.1 penicillin-binding protein 2 [Anaerolineaceae bacterium]
MLYIIIGLLFTFFAARLFVLQIIEGPEYLAQAVENRTSEVNVATQRGVITDRNDYVLARNVASYNIVITPANLPGDEGAMQQVFRELSDMIGVPVNNGELTDETARLFKVCETDFGISQIVEIGDTNKPYSPIEILCNVDERLALAVQGKSADWPGVGVTVSPVREYPTGELTAEIIGFLGPIPASLEDYYTELGFQAGRDKVGYAGVEYELQDQLGGMNGLRVIEVDVAGKEMRDLVEPIAPIPGNNIRLTIDTRLQSVAKSALISEINFWNTYLGTTLSSQGVVIAMNPKTGEILALVSHPTYQNNRMAREIPAYYYEQLQADANRPLFNHAISGEYPPGSVYKIAAAMGALNEKVVTPEQQLMDEGKITIMQKYYENDPGQPREYVCWEEFGHGLQDFLHGIANSCDVYFYKIGGGFGTEVPNGLGIWRMAEYARALGYGKLTGIELPGEMPGLVPDPTWKRINVAENWSTGDTYIATIGQGYVLSTPLQVLVSFATIANDGLMVKPTLIKDIINAEGELIQSSTPTILSDITRDNVINEIIDNKATGNTRNVEPWVIDLIKEGLRMVITEGTAVAEFEGFNFNAAGKTGTAEYCDNVAQSLNLCQPGNWPAHAWFVGYAPYDNPEIVVVAFVYNGKEGSTVAAPIVRKVLEAYFELKQIDATSGRQ